MKKYMQYETLFLSSQHGVLYAYKIAASLRNLHTEEFRNLIQPFRKHFSWIFAWQKFPSNMWKPTQIYMFILHALYKTIKVNEMGESIQLP
jgi:hypothetical protein